MQGKLTAPDTAGGPTLHDVLARRRSVREFADEPLTTAELSQLLWACQGITSESGKRAAPSAGATYPLEIYVVTREGLFHYDPAAHALVQLSGEDLRAALAVAAHDQASVAVAGATFAITAEPGRTERKYGERACLYVKLDAGHAAQNLLLQAVALELGGVPIGSFSERAVSEVLHLTAEHEPVYMVAVGRPVTK
jgi:SagB-type dehydrogenase family enzyme